MWDLKTKTLLIFLHSWNLKLALILRLFFNLCFGITCGKRALGVVSQLVTTESRHLWPQKHPSPIIRQVTGV